MYYIEDEALTGRRRSEDKATAVYRHLEDVADGMEEGL